MNDAPQTVRMSHHVAAGRRYRARSAYAPQRRRGAAVLCAAFLLTVLVLLPVVLEPGSLDVYYLALLLTGATLLPLVVRAASGTLDIFEPIILVSLLIGLAYGVRAMYVAYDPASLLDLYPIGLRFDDYMNAALVLALAGYGSLLVGYYVVAGPMPVAPLATRSFARRAWPPSKVRGAKITALLAIAAAATIARGPGSDDVTGATLIVAVLGSFAQVSACVLALYIAAGDDRRWLRLALWFVALPLAVVQALAFGAKAPVLLSLYAVMAGYHYAGNRLRLRVVVPAVVVAVLFVFPVVNSFRIEPDRLLMSGGQPVTAAEFIGRVREIPTLFRNMTAAEYVESAATGVLGRSTGVDTLSLLLKYDVSTVLGNPKAYAYIPVYAFIPRVIWPDKPVLSQGTDFGRLFFAPSFEGRNSVASFGIFHLGDLLVSFGIPGVLIGMCVLGCMYRLAYRFFDPVNSTDLGVKFLYIFVLWYLVNGFESDIPTVYGNLLKSLLVWMVVKIWLNAPAPHTTVRWSPAAERQRSLAPPHHAVSALSHTAPPRLQRPGRT